MGNEQSREETTPRRQPNRLSKPRTNNNSSSNLLQLAATTAPTRAAPDQPGVPERRVSLVAVAEQGGSSTTRAEMPARPSSGRRRSFFRSKSSLRTEEEARLEELQQACHNGGPSRMGGGPLDRYSRSATMSYEALDDSQYPSVDIRPPTYVKRHSSGYLPYSQQSSRLSLVVEQRSPVDVETRSPLPYDIPGGGSLDEKGEFLAAPLTERSNSDNSSQYPIRCRSLQTPGIATRKSSVEDMSRRPSITQSIMSPVEPPEPMPITLRDRQKSWRKSYRSTKNASEENIQRHYSEQQADPAWISTEYFPPPLPTEVDHLRTATPTDLDVGHIGSHKLGSLRITNGTVSPSPTDSDMRPVKALSPTSTPQGIAEVAGHGSNSAHQEQQVSTLGWAAYQGEIFELPGDYPHPTSQTNQTASQSRHENGARRMQHRPKLNVATDKTSEESLRLFSFERSMVNPHSPMRASQMAQAYQTEIAASPFSFVESKQPSPVLEATSKHTALEDELFEDGTESSVSTTAQHVSSDALDAQVGPGHLDYDETPALVVTKPIDSSQQQPQLQGDETSGTLLAKADSGYSTASARSANSQEPSQHFDSKAAPPVPDKNPPPTPPKTIYSRNSYGWNVPPPFAPKVTCPSQTITPLATPATPMARSKEEGVREIYGLHVDTNVLRRPPIPRTPPIPSLDEGCFVPPVRAPPPIPAKDEPKEIQAIRPTLALKPATPNQSFQAKKTPIAVQSAEMSVPQSTLLNARQSLPAMREGMGPSHSPSGSDTSTSSFRKRRFSRSRPRSQEVTVQHVAEISPDSVPAVPKAAEDKLEERLRTLPVLTHTYKNVHRTNSKETLATIMSMGSAEQSNEDVNTLKRYSEPIPMVPENSEIEDCVGKTGRRDESYSSKMSVGSQYSTASRRFSHRDASYSSKFSQDSVYSQNSRRSSAGSMRNRSASYGQHDAAEHRIASFGSVGDSLGASPYDRGFEALGPRSRSSSMSSATVKNLAEARRGKSVGMDDASAAQFARERSTERRRSLSLRRISSDSKTGFDDRGGIPGRLPTPKSLGEETPPVPALPSEGANSGGVQKKIKTPPPVSMTTQKRRSGLASQPPVKAAPEPAVGSSAPAIPVMNDSPATMATTRPFLLMPGRQGPTLSGLQQKQDIRIPKVQSPGRYGSPPVRDEAWEEQRRVWAEKRQLMNETLHKQPSRQAVDENVQEHPSRQFVDGIVQEQPTRQSEDETLKQQTQPSRQSMMGTLQKVPSRQSMTESLQKQPSRQSMTEPLQKKPSRQSMTESLQKQPSNQSLKKAQPTPRNPLAQHPTQAAHFPARPPVAQTPSWQTLPSQGRMSLNQVAPIQTSVMNKQNDLVSPVSPLSAETDRVNNRISLVSQPSFEQAPRRSMSIQRKPVGSKPIGSYFPEQAPVAEPDELEMPPLANPNHGIWRDNNQTPLARGSYENLAYHGARQRISPSTSFESAKRVSASPHSTSPYSSPSRTSNGSHSSLELSRPRYPPSAAPGAPSPLSQSQRQDSLSPFETGTESPSLYDRFGGGLSYGYEGRDLGLGGSAGMRQGHTKASRKSIEASLKYGLDFSDVPVMVRLGENGRIHGGF